MSERKKNIISGIVFLAFAIALYAGSFSIVLTTADIMGPQFFPRAIAVFIGILAVVQIIMAYKRPETGEKGTGGEGSAAEAGSEDTENGPEDTAQAQQETEKTGDADGGGEASSKVKGEE